MRILRFITEKSVEEAMFARARYKLDIDDKVIQAGRFDNKSTVEEQEEFLVRRTISEEHDVLLMTDGLVSAASSKPIKRKRTRRRAT